MQNIVIVQQGCGRYLFSAPEGISLKEGEQVKCQTRRGITGGTVSADSICVESEIARWIGKLTGATWPLKPVVGRMEYREFEKPEGEPAKLYCAKTVTPFLTEGEIYEIKDGKMKSDLRAYSIASSFEELVRKDPRFRNCLVPLVKRPAKIGEYILVTRANGPAIYDHRYDLHDLLKVTQDDSNIIDQWKGKAVAFQNVTHPDRPWQACVLEHEAYLVLDGYHPEPEHWTGKVVCVQTDLTTLTEGKCYAVSNGTLTFDNGGERSFDVHTAKEFVDTFRGNTKFIEYKGE